MENINTKVLPGLKIVGKINLPKPKPEQKKNYKFTQATNRLDEIKFSKIR